MVLLARAERAIVLLARAEKAIVLLARVETTIVLLARVETAIKYRPESERRLNNRPELKRRLHCRAEHYNNKNTVSRELTTVVGTAVYSSFAAVVVKLMCEIRWKQAEISR